MNWAGKRKMIYGIGVVLALTLITVYVFRDTLFRSPTCFDGKQNGFEIGVDCGGECSLRCTQEVIPLAVSWARAVRTSSTTYDFIALVSNKNLDSAPRELAYAFSAYDAAGLEVAHVEGTTLAPIDGDFPIIKQNIKLSRAPSEVSATVASNVPHYKVLEKPTVPTLKVVHTRYEAGNTPRVYATIQNQKRTLLRNLPVRVLLYDASGNVFAGGETIIPELNKEASSEIVFTWKTAFPEAPTRVRVFPILDPFLGSR